MPSRTSRRRRWRQIAWAEGLDETDRRAAIRRHLIQWKAEARDRAAKLGDLPTIRVSGRLLVVTAGLGRMLGLHGVAGHD